MASSAAMLVVAGALILLAGVFAAADSAISVVSKASWSAGRFYEAGVRPEIGGPARRVSARGSFPGQPGVAVDDDAVVRADRPG